MQKYFLFGLYLLLSLLVGEFHPLSKYPMYNAFPNYAYVFYTTDEKEQLVPYLKNFQFSKNASYIAFAFYSISDLHNYPYGFGKENPIHLKNTGKELLEVILDQENIANYNFDTLKIYRRFYFIEDKQIHYTDQMLYEKALHP